MDPDLRLYEITLTFFGIEFTRHVLAKKQDVEIASADHISVEIEFELLDRNVQVLDVNPPPVYVPTCPSPSERSPPVSGPASDVS